MSRLRGRYRLRARTMTALRGHLCPVWFISLTRLPSCPYLVWLACPHWCLLRWPGILAPPSSPAYLTLPTLHVFFPGLPTGLLSRFHCQRVLPGLASPTFSWLLYLSCLTRLPSIPTLASMSILSCFRRCFGLRSCLSSQMLYLVFLLPPCPVKLPSFPDFACLPWRLH